ncbi:MAG: dephospho-CoA kinase [Candidatus Cloacimonetes bacterium]|jgi:dephospho-CoA kinase|nr:dephospho-CoA kinase [Candidatus Cloacimonadota bacterium]
MQEKKKVVRIVITGNIGSGKSQFCQYLEELGESIVYADEIAREAFQEQSAIWIERWGRGILTNDIVDRKKVAEIVFKDSQELDFLNANTHPQTLARFEQISQNSSSDYVLFEVPLVFEAKITHLFDYIVLVTADRDLVLKRLALRNPDELENMKLRLDSQMADTIMIDNSDLVIFNNDTKEALKAEAQRFLKLLPSLIAPENNHPRQGNI